MQSLVRRVQGLLDQEATADRVDLLAFHRQHPFPTPDVLPSCSTASEVHFDCSFVVLRWRVDEGPGTRADPDDAAHFSVRSPSLPPAIPALAPLPFHPSSTALAV